jgi:DNA repair photolyase
MSDHLPRQADHGRGALSRPTPRFDREAREAVDDGWYIDSADQDSNATTIHVDSTKTIISKNKSPDIPFEQSINPYRGCEHGCIYCFARPSHAYLGLSPGIDFEKVIFAKPAAGDLLAKELSKPTYICKPIALGTNTDPYQPIERKWQIMRRVLEVLRDHRHPVSIVTKGALVVRDLDLLAPMAATKLASVAISVTTLDRDLARMMEPRASTPAKRLHAIEALSKAGIPVSVMAAPMIPGLNDHELEAILAAARDHGAQSAGYVLLRLPLEIKDLFSEWLETHVPLRARHVLDLIRDTREGKLNSSEWGERMRGQGPYADLIAQRFRLAVKRLGLDQRRDIWGLDTTQFRRPPQQGDQLNLF